MPGSAPNSAVRSNTFNPHFPPHELSLPPPPQVVAHHVWLLDCSHCGTFITNRGMKAVLLLRPNVSLYSSDALPANCSAYSPKPGAEYPKPEPPIALPTRTCDCLTQSLCCHGCGHTIGYMIVIPCVRCTSSISASNRTTNGHRFVFHSSEVAGTERHYILNEPGIVATDQITPSRCPLASPYSFFNSGLYDPVPYSPHALPTPPLDPDEPLSSPDGSEGSLEEYEEYDMDDVESMDDDDDHRNETNTSFIPLESMPFIAPPEAKEPPSRAPPLKEGDMLYWHHLSRTGEIPGVFDDERSRTGSRERKGGVGLGELNEASKTSIVLCGR